MTNDKDRIAEHRSPSASGENQALIRHNKKDGGMSIFKTFFSDLNRLQKH